MMRSVSIVVTLGAALWLFTPNAAIAQEDSTCLACHSAQDQTLTFPSKESLSITVEPNTVKNSVHGSVLTCVSCHPQNAKYPHPPIAHRTVRDFTIAASKVCATCHDEPAKAFADSVHARALNMGLADVPTCTTCHGSHAIVKATTAAFRNTIPQLCGKCHGDPAIMQRYGLRAVYQTYIQEFHGVTTTLYKLTKPYSPTPAAICSDCHGVHGILAATNPTSPVNRANVLTTCKKCHPTAGRFFATAWTEHKTPSPSAAPLVYYVQMFYQILIPSVVTFLGVLLVLDLGHWAGDQLRRPRP